jgi:peptide-methionine (R)-S-oxide reductase
MKSLPLWFGFGLLTLLSGGCNRKSASLSPDPMHTDSTTPISLSDEEWRKRLTPEQYRILREKGTEYPGTGTYNLHFEKGTYRCAGCGTPLFSSESKFDSHCGWPSFDAALANGKVAEKRDLSHGMVRTEIVCANCGGHLGHVFPDGPTETGLRYCVNSLSLEFTGKTDSTDAQD